MPSFEFFPQESDALRIESEQLAQETAGTFEGIGGAIVKAPPRAVLKAAESLHIMATGLEPGLSDEERDARFKRTEDAYRPAIEELSPKSWNTGTAGQIVGGFLEAITYLGAGARAGVVGPAYTEAPELVRLGADAATATQVGAGLGLSGAVGFAIPFLGKTLSQRILAGVGTNVALGAATDWSSSLLLEEGGYAELAKRYDPANAHARILDALIGGAFGGVAHLAAGRGRLDPGTADAVLELNRQRQLMRDTLPGKPATAADLQAHASALERATEQASAGLAVDVATIIEGRDFGTDKWLEGEREQIRRLADEARSRALGSGYLERDIPRAGALPKFEREVEGRFARYLVENFEKAARDYEANPETAGGKIINTDEARKLSADYSRDRASAAGLSRAVHEPASWFTKRMYERLLDAPLKPGEDNVVVFTAGGTGAGKTTAIGEARGGMFGKAHAIYDTNANGFESTVRKIDEARARNYQVQFIYVARDPVDALLNGSLTRAENPENNGRTVPIKEHAATHKGSAETLPRLLERYKDDPDVVIQVIDNTHGPNNARAGDINTIKGIDFNNLEARLYAALEQAYKEGRISESTYKGTKGVAARGERSAPQGVDRKPQQKGQATQPGAEKDLTPREIVTQVADVPNIEAALEGSRVTNVGHVTTVQTERGTKIGVRYALIEADKLRTSHTDELQLAKNYDQRLQPRERERASSEAQVARIAGNLDFQRLADNPGAADGAPIIGPDDQVESGNARSIAIRRAYKSGKANAYRQALIDRAPDLGLDPQVVAQMREPVLVRQRVSQVRDRAAFAVEANEQAQARMSLAEQARADAGRISSLDGLTMNEDGSINMRESRGFIRRFLGDAVSPTDQGAMMRPDGSLSAEGTARIRNAIFARAYGDPDLVSMLVEGSDQNVRNVLTGLSRAAGDIADIRDGARDGYYQPVDISSDVAAAARLYAEIKATGNTVEGYLQNQALFDPINQLQRELLATFELHARSGRRLGEVLQLYAELVREQGSPAQIGLLGDPETALSRESLLAEAAKKLDPDKTSATPNGNERPLGQAAKGDDTVEGKQAAAIINANPDLMVAYDDQAILSGSEALALADAEIEEANAMAAAFDEVAADITPATLNAAEGDVGYVEARRRPYNPDQLGLDFQEVTPIEAAAASQADVETLRRQPNELARAIAKDFSNAKSSELIGARIRNATDLAVAAQVYRNPRFETIRYLFMKGDKVVHATGVSSRMVGAADAFATKRILEPDTVSGQVALQQMMAAYGADGIYLVHNHPSGDPQPSQADITMTRVLNQVLGGRVRGHVVVNHNRFAHITATGKHVVAPLPGGNVDLHATPAKAHPLLGSTILAASDLVDLAHRVKATTTMAQAESFVVVGRNSDGKVSGILEYPLEFANRNPMRLAAEIRRYKLGSGSREVFLVGPQEFINSGTVRRGIITGLVRDAVNWSGDHSMAQHSGLERDSTFQEGKMRSGGNAGFKVEEDGASYTPANVTPAEQLTAGQIERIRGLVREKLRYLQSVKLRGFDPEINKLSDQELAREATRRAKEEIVQEAQEKKRRVHLAAIAADRNAQLQAAHPEGLMRGLVGMMVRDKADKGSAQSFESREAATRGWALARLMPALEATNPGLFGLIEDRQGWRDLVREIYGENTGNAAAKAGAKAWLEVMEDLREQANFAGFDIAKLHSYRLPQSHSRKALQAAGAAKWIADVMPKLDRDRYVNEDGRLFDEKEMEAFLAQAYENIVTNGMNNLEPGAYRGNSPLAAKYQEHRAIHFAKPDDYVDYLAAYGGEGSIHGVITGHVQRMARDIALVETFGPNPDKAFQVLRDRATMAGEVDTLDFAENLFHEIRGATQANEIPTWAEWSQGLRNLLVSAKLGGAAISSITDNATLHITAQLNNLSSMRIFRNQVAQLGSADRAAARANGLGLDVFTQSLNRWGEEGLGSNITGKLAAGTLRASGLQALTEANKRAFGATMMAGIGKLSRQPFAKLAESDNRILASKGITEQDWKIWQMAELEDWGGGGLLTPQAIARIPLERIAKLNPDVPAKMLRNQAITRLLGAVLEETDTAVITTGYRERAILRQGTKSGTVAGELARHVTLFKSFPTAMIARHWTRALSQPTAAGKLVYGATLFTTLTILGAVAMTIKDVVAGKDPRSFKDPRTWLAAMAQGGGLGIYGDFIFSDSSRYGNSLTATLAGPSAGVLEDAYALSIGNVHQAIRGEETHAAAEALQFVKGNTPLINLWYTKAALDRLILNDMQDYLSPGYLSRVRQTTERNTGQEFWWTPGEAMPDRAPALEAIAQ